MGYFSTEEILEILLAVGAISLAFTLAFGGVGIQKENFLLYMLIFTITVGTGFVLHELAHKFVAIRYGAGAMFKVWPIGLGLMLILAVTLGFIFAAPGAVYIFGPYISRKQNGLISLAGPATNLLLGLLFAVSVLIFHGTPIAGVAFFGFYVNIFLGLFNMIPIFPLDGSKVFRWDARIWGAFTGLMFLLFLSTKYFGAIASAGQIL